MAGLVYRINWVPAISETQVEAMRGARLELKREAKLSDKPEAEEQTEPAAETKQEEEAEFTMSRDQYLEQVENAATFYDVLGVPQRADTDELKRAYFQLARNFHPDRYHSEGGEMLKRMQNAFRRIIPALGQHLNYRSRKSLAKFQRRLERILIIRIDNLITN